MVRLALESPPAREGAAEALLQERVPQHALQLHARARGRRAVRRRRRSCTATRRSRAIRCRLARSGRSARAARRPAPGSIASRSRAARAAACKILNQPTPPPFRESVKVGEQNLYTRAKELVGDRDPREHEFSIQMRAMDADKTGTGLGLPVLVALVRRAARPQHARRNRSSSARSISAARSR